jgi:hypothetical protein
MTTSAKNDPTRDFKAEQAGVAADPEGGAAGLAATVVGDEATGADCAAPEV